MKGNAMIVDVSGNINKAIQFFVSLGAVQLKAIRFQSITYFL